MSMPGSPRQNEGDKPLGEKIESLRVRDLQDGHTITCVGSRLIRDIGIKYAESGYVDVEGAKVVVSRAAPGFLLSATLPDGSSTVMFPAIWIEASNTFKKGAVMRFKIKGGNDLGLRYFDFVVGDEMFLDNGEVDDIHTRETEGMRKGFKKGVEKAAKVEFPVSEMVAGDQFLVHTAGEEFRILVTHIEPDGKPYIVVSYGPNNYQILQKGVLFTNKLMEGGDLRLLDDEGEIINPESPVPLHNLNKVPSHFEVSDLEVENQFVFNHKGEQHVLEIVGVSDGGMPIVTVSTLREGLLVKGFLYLDRLSEGEKLSVMRESGVDFDRTFKMNVLRKVK